MAPVDGHQLQLSTPNSRARVCFGIVYKGCKRSEGGTGDATGFTANKGSGNVPSVSDDLELAVSTFPKNKILTSCHIDERPGGDTRSIRDRIRETAGHILHQTKWNLWGTRGLTFLEPESWYS
jgi:hypothetical protein